MKLALNTFIFEVGKVSLFETVRIAKEMKFNCIDIAAYRSSDFTKWKEKDRKDFIQMFKDLGLRSSQLLMVNTEYIASSDERLRKNTIEHMKRCAEFQLELGGKQVLICWGCGVYEASGVKEQNWLNAVYSIREYAEWSLKNAVVVALELDPHVYFIVNNLKKMSKMLEDVDMPNVFPNIDIGHLCITRDPPKALEKFRDKIIHIHLSETDTYAHTNSILGTGKVDFKAYIDKIIEMGFEETCARNEEVAVASIEMGELNGEVDDPKRWVMESLTYLKTVLPELTI